MRTAEKILTEVEKIHYPSEGIGCGLEDTGITDRYEAAAYGWNEAVERISEIIRLYLDDDNWIPVKDHLPEERFFKVYVTIRYKNHCTVFKARWNNGRFEHENGAKMDVEILAWMPRVPKPYKPREEQCEES